LFVRLWKVKRHWTKELRNAQSKKKENELKYRKYKTQANLGNIKASRERKA
jgi:hypothetical protein